MPGIARRLLHLMAAVGMTVGAAQAATINVSPGAVDTATNGNCSLIEAIQAAETDTAVDGCTAGSGADTIIIPAGTYTLTAVDNVTTGQNGLPVITTSMTINGAGAGGTTITRSGSELFRFFRIASTGNLVLNGVTLTNGNSTVNGHDGGAIRNFGALTVLNSVLSGNVSNAGGSAIFSQGASSVLSVTNTAIFGNSGSAAVATCCGGTTSITNSTIAGNANGGIESGNALTVSFSTIAANTGDGILQSGGTTTVDNSIIANNTVNCSDPVVNAGNNLQFPGASCGAAIPTANPQLGPLANNGGPPTMALSPTSPAVDAASSATCPATDQRGVRRPQDPTPPTVPPEPFCDIGAFELAPSATVIPTLSEWMLLLMSALVGGIGLLHATRPRASY